MVRRSNMIRRIILWAGLALLVAAGMVLRHKTGKLTLHRRTVASTVAELREKRGPELMRSYPDMLALHEVFLIAVEKTRRLEVWTRTSNEEFFRFRKSYRFTGFSGQAGPKKRSGDRQIPEGIYAIEGLNPSSRQHPSLK